MMTSALPRRLFVLFGAAALAAQAWAGPAATTQAQLAVPVTAASAPPPHEDEATHIRRHHLKRLAERLSAEPGELERTCRYESEIATAPPPGRVALTFDDGPTPGGTEHILALLRKYHISATFFMVGAKAKQYPELVAKVRAAGGQVVANHSWDHPNFHELTPAAQAEQVLRNEALLGDDPQAKLFRYPFGNSTCETNELVRARGYKIAGWHIDSCDWAYDKTGTIDQKEAISCGVPAQFHSDFVGHVVAAARARKGGIILMHEIHPNTLARLEAIIEQLLAAGFSFGTITEPDFRASLR